MSDEQGYNGWKNYETWVTALWIDNDEGSYNLARELVKDAQREVAGEYGDDMTGDDVRSITTGQAADALKAWLEEAMELYDGGNACLFTDLLRAAFSEIDWYEIAANYLSEVAAA